MKKLFTLFLASALIFTLAACSGDEVSSSAPSDTTSSEEELEGGVQINYTSVANGYIDHSLAYGNEDIMEYSGWQCMKDEYLIIPKGATIMSYEKAAVYCYVVNTEKEKIYVDPTRCERLGQSLAPNGYSIQAKPLTVTLEDTIIARISVKGELSDVQVFLPADGDKEVLIFSPEELIEYVKEHPHLR